MVLLQWWPYVVVEQGYVVDVVGDNVCVLVGGLYGFNGQQYGKQLYFKDVLVSCEYFCYAELVLGLYIHEPAIFPIMWPSAFLVGGVKEPSMQIHCMPIFTGKLYLFGSSVYGWRCFVDTLTLGVCFHWYEKLMLQFEEGGGLVLQGKWKQKWSCEAQMQVIHSWHAK